MTERVPSAVCPPTRADAVQIRSHAGLLAVLALSVGGLTALALSVSAGAASGQVCMGVVIDAGSGSAPLVQAANVAPGTTSDLQAMSTAGDTFAQNNSGLVCAINNYPANGVENCLSAQKGQFFYWSYWQGNPDTNTWTYASVGPASHDVGAGQDYVEGWRYQDPGPDNPTAPPPTVTPTAAFQACATTSTPTTSGGGSGSSGGGGGSGAPAPSTDPTTAPTTQPTTAVASGSVPPVSGHGIAPTTCPKGPPPSTSTTTSSAPPRTSTTTSTTAVGACPKSAARAAPPPAPSSTSTTVSGTTVGVRSQQKVQTSPARVAEAETSARGQGGGAPVWPIIIVAVVILLLGSVSWYRWARRPAEE
jgi:hypothetical protein